MKYKSVIVTQRGGPEVFQVVENELREPSAREARIRALAVPVCLPDVQARYGQSMSLFTDTTTPRLQIVSEPRRQ